MQGAAARGQGMNLGGDAGPSPACARPWARLTRGPWGFVWWGWPSPSAAALASPFPGSPGRQDTREPQRGGNILPLLSRGFFSLLQLFSARR